MKKNLKQIFNSLPANLKLRVIQLVELSNKYPLMIDYEQALQSIIKGVKTK